MQELPSSTTARLTRSRVLVAVGLLLLLPALLRPLGTDPLASLDQLLYDLALQTALAPSAHDAGVVVVAVDDETLDELGQRWPISRDHHAALIRALAVHRPAVIAFDVVFDQPTDGAAIDVAADTLDWLARRDTGTQRAVDGLKRELESQLVTLDHDRAMAEAVASTRVVLGAMVLAAGGSHSGEQARLRGSQWHGSVTSLADAAHSHGTVNVLPDPDQILRRYPYLVEHRGGLARSLALAAVEAARPELAMSGEAANWALSLDRGAPLVPWSHPPAVPVLRMSDLLAGSVPRDEVTRRLAGALVFIGATATGADDEYSLAGTPRVPGVMVHAQATQALIARAGRTSEGLAAWLGLLLAGALTMMLALWGARRPPAIYLVLATMTLLSAHIGGTLLLATIGMWTGAAPGVVALLGLGAITLLLHQRELEADRTLLLERDRLAVEAQAVKDGFISVVSHELRTPLTSIKGSLGLILGGVTGEIPARARTMTQLAHDNAVRLNRLVDDLLDVAKIEAGRLELDVESLDLRDVIGEAVESNAGFAAEHDVVLEISEHHDPIRVEADRTRLVQVLSNLLSNAMKYSPAGGVVQLASVVESKQVRVMVEDRGSGIPDELHARIFEKFSQARGPGANAKGTGLGLGITKAIVEGHHGDIGFDTAVGVGTTFWFTLPTAAAGNGAAPVAESPGQYA